MRKIIQVFKFIVVLFIIVTFLILSTLINLIPVSDWTQQKWRLACLSVWAGWVVKTIGFKINVLGSYDKSKPHLIVSNHLSYMDVMIISATMPTRFVTSVEMGKAPGLGILTNVGGCLFVERRNRANLNKEIEMIAENLRRGINVVVFPEATSTNGEGVLPFKRPLFKASSLGNVSVLPICLNYKLINGQPLNKSNRDSVFWYGDMDFVPHLWNMLALKKVEVEFNVLPTLNSDGKEVDELSSTSYELITERFITCPT